MSFPGGIGRPFCKVLLWDQTEIQFLGLDGILLCPPSLAVLQELIDNLPNRKIVAGNFNWRGELNASFAGKIADFLARHSVGLEGTRNSAKTLRHLHLAIVAFTTFIWAGSQAIGWARSQSQFSGSAQSQSQSPAEFGIEPLCSGD
jgi:hypothetical protein